MARIPVDRMTCWELVDQVASVAKKFAEESGEWVEELSWADRDVLLNLLGAIEDADATLKSNARAREDGSI